MNLLRTLITVGGWTQVEEHAAEVAKAQALLEQRAVVSAPLRVRVSEGTVSGNIDIEIIATVQDGAELAARSPARFFAPLIDTVP
jgi:hypothetical protein